MANERMVIDTGPLILLAKVTLLSVVSKLPYSYIAPQIVMDELAAGMSLGYQKVQAPWLAVHPLASSIPAMICSTLDEGEAAVIQLALESDIRLVCIDDLRGRRMAKAVGLEVIGVLGLVGKAKRFGLIPAVKPYIERLLTAGAHYSPDLIAAIQSDAGE